MDSILQAPVAGQAVSMVQVIASVLLTLAISLLIAQVYKRTHRGLSYSQSFVFTLVLMSIVSAVVMMIIGSSLARAFGLLGAFSVIRFRTAVKDTRDTCYIFFSLAMGLAVGTGNYALAVVATVLIVLILLVLDKVNFGSIRKYRFVLSLVMRQGQGGSNTSFEGIFKKYLKNTVLLNINSKEDGQASEMTYHVNFIDDHQGKNFVADISAIPGVERVHLITATEDVEY